MPQIKDGENRAVLKLKSSGRAIDVELPAVMGILNITSDSFYDGGKYRSEKSILTQVERMLAEGASIIDAGAVSTRPGAVELPEAEEWNRLEPVLKAIRLHFPTAVLSVDTYRSRVAERSVGEGAQLINDISGGTFDDRMPKTIAGLNIPYIMMHIQGKPQDMQLNPLYHDVVKDVKKFFEEQIRIFRNQGMKEHIIIDPGFGFGKTLAHNYLLLGNLKVFRELGCPVMAGLSRKSMINKVLETKPDAALNGTTVLHAIALMNGADFLRVHDVKEAVEAIRLVGFYQKTNEDFYKS
jgi:dihydropteroate synthase